MALPNRSNLVLRFDISTSSMHRRLTMQVYRSIDAYWYKTREPKCFEYILRGRVNGASHCGYKALYSMIKDLHPDELLLLA